MVAALKKKHTLDQTGFDVNDDGFVYGGRQFSFDDVIETRIIRSVLQTTTVFVGSDFDHSVSILFVTKNGQQLQVTEQPTWVSNSKLKTVERIENMFSKISEMSKTSRIKKYTSQIEKFGYFDYSGWRFFTRELKVVHIAKNKEFRLSEVSLLKSYGFISIKPNSESLISKFLSKAFNEVRDISTITDTDIIFPIYKKYLSVSWN